MFFSVSMTLDGFMAPEAVSVEDVFPPEGQTDPRVQRLMANWSELQAWAFPQRFFVDEGIEGRARPGPAWPWSRVRAEPTRRVTHLTHAVREP